MTLRLYDTAAREVRDFTPSHDGRVTVYLCGATVQGVPHIGHVRSGIAFDVLRRWLAHAGNDVLFVRNVTDIDDKILRKAAEAGRPWWEWAATHERAFDDAYRMLGVLPPSAEPRATGFIPQMIGYMRRLIDRGHAYVADGNVYFDVLSLPSYGALSGHRLADVHQGIRFPFGHALLASTEVNLNKIVAGQSSIPDGFKVIADDTAKAVTEAGLG